jgi:hypothetical protein
MLKIKAVLVKQIKHKNVANTQFILQLHDLDFPSNENHPTSFQTYAWVI